MIATFQFWYRVAALLGWAAALLGVLAHPH